MGIVDLIAEDHKEWISVCKSLGAGHLSEDLVQEMYIKIHNSKLTTDDNIKGYAYFVLKNLCIDFYRQKKYNLELKDDLVEDNCKTDSRLEYLDIQKAIHYLPYFERKVLELHKIDGLSLCEIERETNVNRVKMMHAKNNAIEKLKKHLYG